MSAIPVKSRFSGFASSFRLALGAMPPALRRRQSELVAITRSILAKRGFSLADIARQSRTRFSGSPLFRIPPNFYDALRRASFSPSLHQLYALSVLTRYRLADWLRVFGFSLDDAARFQACFPRHRTAELDARVYDASADVSWFEEAQTISLGSELAPLSQWLFGKTLRPLASLTDRTASSSRYLKIGSRDAYAFPDLLPGSIVRINNRLTPDELLTPDNANRILAIERVDGILCGRVRKVGRGRVVLCSRQLPYAPLELKLETEAKIFGYVDMEIRRLEPVEIPEVQASWKPPTAHSGFAIQGARIGEVARRARMRSSLSFREVSERTAEIARVLQHPNYFCAPSALSDLEARDVFPRHIHKLISLSAVYGVPILDLADLAGLPLDETGREAMPAEWTNVSAHQTKTPSYRPSRLLSAIEGEIQEVPFFLRRALPSIFGLPHLSVRDLFWAGATEKLAHPYLQGAVFLAVNRKNKIPAPALSSPVWAQPLYVLELRNGRRLCAACSLQDGILVVRPCTNGSGDLLRLRHRDDAEVLGKVVALVRRL
jgi:transcriptional regulator with XRE-family HTH domain